MSSAELKHFTNLRGREDSQLRTIAERWQAAGALNALDLAGAVVFFALCTAAGASVRVRLPFSPVPVTGQTFFVLLSGALLGRKLGPLSQGLYLLLAIGVPGAAAGPLHLTAGYVIGFVLAAYAIGVLAHGSRSFVGIVGAMAAGSLIIYLFGAVWLAAATGNATRAILQGVAPFIPGDAFKLLAAATIVAGGRVAARKRPVNERDRNRKSA